MISRVMHCVLASMPLLTKIRRGRLSKFKTCFNAAKFDLDDAPSATPHTWSHSDGHVPDAFGGNGEQKGVSFVNEGSVGELGPHGGDVCRELVVGQLVNTTVMLIKVVAKVLRAAP